MAIQLSDKGKGQRLYQEAKHLMPGGTQLLSKRPEMFLPDYWPAYYDKAKGAEIWDLDGNHYIDMSYCGIGSTVLGYADPDVDDAVLRAIGKGSMCTLNSPEDVDLAKLMLELHPWAQKVRFARCGGEAMAIAVRIARAFTRRDKIAFCGYHGWHDWYLAANIKEDGALDDHLLSGLEPAGVPKGLLGSALPFHYNKIDELKAIINMHRGDIGVIVMEPLRGQMPLPGFLESVREIADDIGAVLIFDEITSGFRICPGGVHLNQNVVPDMAVFAKAIGNGYPMSAVIGLDEVMNAAQTSFISSTYWTERIGPAAALATIRKFLALEVAVQLIATGREVKRVWQSAAKRSGLDIQISGMDPLGHFSFSGPEAQAAKTLFTQLMLESGFLATTSFYSMYAHTAEHVQSYALAVGKAFSTIADALRSGAVKDLLKGPVAHTGFVRLT